MNLCTVEDKTVVFSPLTRREPHLRIKPTPQATRGPIISHFRLIRQLGRGGMGAVYLAEDLTLGRNVAIKFMDRAAIGEMVDEEDDCTVVRDIMTTALEQRFIREAKSAATISHQNLAQIYEAHFDDDEWFIAMEYINGQSLEAMLKDDHVFTKEEIINVCRQTVLGLKYAWERHSIVHRDIKPGNIMVTPEGKVKIVDLGLAKPLGDDQPTLDVSECGAALGTPLYASPEQARAEGDLDCLTDIYSLGATLYEMCTGEKAFIESTPAAVYQRQLNRNYVPIRDARRDIPASLVRLIDRMLAPERADRMNDYDAILKALEQLDRPDDTVKIKVPKRVRVFWDYVADLDYAYLFPTYDSTVKTILTRPLALWALAFMVAPLLIVAISPGPSKLIFVSSMFSSSIWWYMIGRDSQVSWKRLFDILKMAGIWSVAIMLFYMLITRIDAVAGIYAGEMGAKPLPSFISSFVFIALTEEALKLLPLCLPFVVKRFDLRPRSFLIAGAGIGLLFAIKTPLLFSMENWSYTSLGGATSAVSLLGMFAVVPVLHGMWTGIAAWFLAAARRGGQTQWPVVAIGLFVSTMLHALWSTAPSSAVGICSALATGILFLFYYDRTRRDTRAFSRLQPAD